VKLSAKKLLIASCFPEEGFKALLEKIVAGIVNPAARRGNVPAAIIKGFVLNPQCTKSAAFLARFLAPSSPPFFATAATINNSAIYNNVYP
jgi:hypothetical protein